MSLGLRKYILSDVKVELTATSTPPPLRGERSVLYVLHTYVFGQKFRVRYLRFWPILRYLKSYLSGEALALVKHIPVTNENYSEAWDKFEKRLLFDHF